MNAVCNWFRSLNPNKMEGQPIKQQKTTGIQDLLNTLKDLKRYLTNFLKDLDDMEQKLQETISGISQPVVPKETKKSPFKDPSTAPAELKGITPPELAVSNPNSDETPVSKSDVSINDVIDGFLAKQTSTEKSLMDHADEVFHTLCIQMIDYLERKTPWSPYESNDTKVKIILTDQQSTRRITNLEEGRNVIVQIYISRNANLPKGIIDSLCQLLKRGMSKNYEDGVILPLKIFNTPNDLDSTMPLIVLCPYASRIGVSVDDALNEVRSNENVILLILHHVARHAMNILSSAKKLTLPESTKLGYILDMVFHSEDGIYKCKQNDDTVARITEFLSQYN